jgi:hypothetical protein
MANNIRRSTAKLDIAGKIVKWRLFPAIVKIPKNAVKI